MKTLVLTLIVIVSTLCAFGQAAPADPIATHFNIAASVISLPGNGSNFPAADVGAFVPFMKNGIQLRTDNILGGAIGFQGYYGGIKGPLPGINNFLLNKTYFNPTNWKLYWTASPGVDVTGNGKTAQNHFSMLAGGGLDHYNGKLTENVFEIRWAKLPGFNNSTVVLSTGVHWALF